MKRDIKTETVNHYLYPLKNCNNNNKQKPPIEILSEVCFAERKGFEPLGF